MKSKRADGARRGIGSVETAMRLLAAVGASNRPRSLKAISAACHMAPSNVHRYLASLIHTGFVRQEPETRSYELGPAALQTGLNALMQLDIVRLAGQALAALSERTGVTSMISVWGDQGPTIIRIQRGAQHVVTTLGLGTVLPALGSATGRVLLAHLDPASTAGVVHRERNRLARAGFPAVSAGELQTQLQATRDAGLAWADGSFIPGLRAVSGPVLDAYGVAALAITLVSAQDAITAPGHPAVIALRDTCRELSRNAGLTSSASETSSTTDAIRS